MTTTTPAPVRPSSLTRWGRAGAAYDLAVTAPFATPWTASLVLDLFRAAHTGLDLPGSPPPEPDALTLLFISLFGSAVLMWSLARWYRPERLLISIDTVGRAAFSVWFAWALYQGQSAITVLFLVLELAWCAAQLRAVTAREDGR